MLFYTINYSIYNAYVSKLKKIPLKLNLMVFIYYPLSFPPFPMLFNILL